MEEGSRNDGGNDNFAHAAGQTAKALRSAGKAVAGQASGGLSAAANAAAASVAANVKGGQAFAKLAAGVAAGGPWGAILSIAWSMRHTLFKVLVCLCLIPLIFVVMLTSLPTIVTKSVFGLDGAKVTDGASINSSFTHLTEVVNTIIDQGYNQALAKVEQIIADGGYDYELSMEALKNYGKISAGYDVSYILSAYSVSMNQKNTDASDMTAKLSALHEEMFPVTFEERTMEVLVEESSQDGEESVAPTTEIIRYAECTILPFDTTVTERAFNLDLNAVYDIFGRTYGDVISSMASALKKMLYGTAGSGTSVPLTDMELIAFVSRQNCNETRKYILSTALSLVGKVPYFWGGKSPPGWNDAWNTPKLVTAAGSGTTGTIRPYGLDCSGFTTWVFMTAFGIDIGAGTMGQFPNSVAVSDAELLPGDLGFLAGSGGGWDHVLIFAGYSESGARMWVHSSGSTGVVLNTPGYDASIVLRRPVNVDFNASVPDNNTNGEILYTLEVDVTHYCACSKCCGPNASGVTASGKPVAVGMVAMSSYYPFGTQIMINGNMYTVEDRGGSGIENDKSRVDIYVPDHGLALQMGRYKTTAQIYRIGR